MIDNLERNIGKKCRKKSITKNKRSSKPFKSGLKINTIKGVIPHKQLEDQMAYIFEEDDSYVECRRCLIIEKKSFLKRLFRL